jgi:hypothetical protein
LYRTAGNSPPGCTLGARIADLFGGTVLAAGSLAAAAPAQFHHAKDAGL